mgnify:CR=1 FL=1
MNRYLLIIHGSVRFPRKNAMMRFSGFAQKALKFGNIVGCFVKKHKKTIRHPMTPVTMKNEMAIAFSKRRLFTFCRRSIRARVQIVKTKNGVKYQGVERSCSGASYIFSMGCTRVFPL